MLNCTNAYGYGPCTVSYKIVSSAQDNGIYTHYISIDEIDFFYADLKYFNLGD